MSVLNDKTVVRNSVVEAVRLAVVMTTTRHKIHCGYENTYWSIFLSFLLARSWKWWCRGQELTLKNPLFHSAYLLILCWYSAAFAVSAVEMFVEGRDDCLVPVLCYGVSCLITYRAVVWRLDAVHQDIRDQYRSV
jgi:hypothetical protein